jgi:uncharacterized protein YbcC (UPF0753/DUF2309 family)
MNAPQPIEFVDETGLRAAVAAACDRVAPTWPLDRFIAVNPYWGRIDRPFEEAGRRLARLAGSAQQMPIGYYREAWRRGDIRSEHLRLALAEAGRSAGESSLIEALRREDPPRPPLPLLSDTLDARRDLSHEPAWRDAILQQLTQFCAAYFDRDQADWRPGRSGGLYRNWLAAMREDHGVALLMHAPEIARRAQGLPQEAMELLSTAARHWAFTGDDCADLLEALLLRVGGWAAWCAYRRWQARLAGADDGHIEELLAARLAWELLLDDGDRSPGSGFAQWRRAWDTARAAPEAPPLDAVPLWQRAHEIAYQKPLAGALARSAAPTRTVPAPVQAVFCIDVRSEVIRRALESVLPEAETFGFAGFFGLPIDYTPLGTSATRPQLPGLLAPALSVTETCGRDGRDRAIASERRARLDARAGWRLFGRMPGASFTLVESLGMGYLGKLLGRSLGGTAEPGPDLEGLTPAQAREARPRLSMPGSAAEQAGLAARVLSAMNLTRDFARLVMLAGHGSRSANNPHASGLDCGACCGQTGEVNARALAGLLNDAAVRESLRAVGIAIPPDTHFLAALHNTTTDDIVIYERDLVPESHRADLQRIEKALAAAACRARAERAPALGLGALARDPGQLARAIRRRASDWAQTRPEWGLANNAAFIVAPRSRSRGIDLQGRAFLHDYDHARDTDGSVLELIMTAPMIVTHWINMQYHASTVDPARYGSGNKVLHNVVGGRIGVFEGNGGDLRIGLPRQSVHDGERWMHAPLRLSVYIEAPRAAIEAVIGKHAVVRQLLDNRWLHLFRIEDGLVEAYGRGQWAGWETHPTRH